MTLTPNAVIADALRANQRFAHRYLDDLKPGEYAHQPFPGVNSAAWVLGHLVLTERRALGALGVTDLPTLPAGFDERFRVTKQAADVQHDLGDPGELLALFDTHRAALIAAVEAAPVEALAAPVPTPGPMYKTAGDVAGFMAQHVAMHMGQVTVIRRNLGYPPVS